MRQTWERRYVFWLGGLVERNRFEIMALNERIIEIDYFF
jgi:hypothetical protein